MDLLYRLRLYMIKSNLCVFFLVCTRFSNAIFNIRVFTAVWLEKLLTWNNAMEPDNDTAKRISNTAIRQYVI